MQQELSDQQRTQAYNSFYRRPHPALHRLVAELKSGAEADRVLSSQLQLAKTTVEASVITFPSSIGAEVDNLIAVAGQGLERIEANAPWACEPSPAGSIKRRACETEGSGPC
jgi:hypothetical protein